MGERRDQKNVKGVKFPFCFNTRFDSRRSKLQQLGFSITQTAFVKGKIHFSTIWVYFASDKYFSKCLKSLEHSK